MRQKLNHERAFQEGLTIVYSFDIKPIVDSCKVKVVDGCTGTVIPYSKHACEELFNQYKEEMRVSRVEKLTQVNRQQIITK